MNCIFRDSLGFWEWFSLLTATISLFKLRFVWEALKFVVTPDRLSKVGIFYGRMVSESHSKVFWILLSCETGSTLTILATLFALAVVRLN